MAKLIYQPSPDDNDTVTVDGVTFAAFEAVDVDDAKADLVAKLKRNPWFAVDVPDQERFTVWKTVRDAQAQAASHRLAAEAIEANPVAAAAADGALRSEADAILANARQAAETAIAQARDLVARAQAEADGILAKAKDAAAGLVAAAQAEVAAVKAASAPPADPEPQPTNQTSTQGGGNP